MSYIFDEFIRMQRFYFYEQDKIDFSKWEFSSMYKKSKEESEIALKSNIVSYVYSIKGRNLIDLEFNV